MKKKILTIILCGVMALSLVACGGSNNSTDGGNSSTEKDNVAEENDVTAENNAESTESVLDVDGVKIPVNVTWEELQAIVAENNREYVGNTHEKLGNTTTSAKIIVKTNVGEFDFNFGEKDSAIKIISIVLNPLFLNEPEKVNINNINVLTKIDSNEVKTFDDCMVQLTPSNQVQDCSMITIVIQ